MAFINTREEIGERVTLDGLIDGTLEDFNDDLAVALIADAFRGHASLKTVNLPNVTSIKEGAFRSCTALTSVSLPKVTSAGSNVFTGCSSLGSLYLPKISSTFQDLSGSGIESLFVPNSLVSGINSNSALTTVVAKGCFTSYNLNLSSNPSLTTVDFTGSAPVLRDSCFGSDGALTVLILRSKSLASLIKVSAFNGTPFRNGGSGGTIYIPKALYDRLGDNSSLDYKKASNWVTVNGYGTITWAQIEGSYYETHYADGTEI